MYKLVGFIKNLFVARLKKIFGRIVQEFKLRFRKSMNNFVKIGICQLLTFLFYGY